MPRAPKPAYYAVRVGRAPGIYLSWADCEAQTKGFRGALYKKLGTEAEAVEFMAAQPSTARTPPARCIVPAPPTSRAVVLAEPIASPSTVQSTHPTLEDERDCDIVYCDGACRGNGRAGSVAGVGVWWGHGDPRNISERCPGDQTNNRAELIAIVRILETTPRLARRLLIKTDSYYSIQSVTSWIFKWMKNGFLAADGKPVKNRALIKYLAALLHVRRKTSQIVEFKHVRGHVGIDGNEAADQLANVGATKAAVPERNWEKLEKEALQSLTPVKPTQVVNDNLKAYADDLWSDGELAELADARIESVMLPVQESRRQRSGNEGHAIRSITPLTFHVPHEVSPPRRNAGAIAAAWPSVGQSSALQSAPSEMPATAQQELEAFASCLLGEEELSALGKDV